MSDLFPQLTSHFESELEVMGLSILELGDTYGYSRFLQETMLMGLANGGQPFEVKYTANNPLVFSILATTRAFSVAKAAMDQVIRGQPQVGLALSRFLSEICQTSQYLVRHPNLIDGYLEGHASLERVLKLAKEETVEAPTAFSLFWGIQSRFSHAGQEFLGLGVETEGNRMRARILIYDEDLLDKSLYGVLAGLFTQYMVFRMVIKGKSAIEEELIDRDSYVFDPKIVRKHLGLAILEDDFLGELHEFFSTS